MDRLSGNRYSEVDRLSACWQSDDQAGLTLIQMAVAFVIRHPAVTSAIIGPRTMEHLDDYLAADGIELSADVLDRIDEIVPPGVTINVADNMWNVGTTALNAAFPAGRVNRPRALAAPAAPGLATTTGCGGPS